MRTLRYQIILLLTTLGGALSGQSITGQWVTFDDKTKEKKSIVEIYEINEAYFGRVIDIYVDDKDAICEVCNGVNKDKPIIGLVIIENLNQRGSKYSGGTIIDPESGKTYKCKLELEGEDKLKVRGFLGVAFLGRTQYWYRKSL